MRFVRFIFSFYFTFIINLNRKMEILASEDKVTIFKCNDGLDNHFNETISLEIFDDDMDPLNSYPLHFRLSEKQDILNCGGFGNFIYSVSLKVTWSEYHSVNSGLNSEGILTVDMGSKKLYRYPKDYCVLSVSSNSVLLSVCNATCDNEDLQKDRLCIKKCCPISYILGYDNGSIGCGEPIGGQDFSNNISLMHKNIYRAQNHQKPLELSIYYESWENKTCSSYVPFIKRHQDFSGDYNEDLNTNEFRFLQNGKLSVYSDAKWQEVKDDFCIDLIQNFSNGNGTLSEDFVTLSTIQCVPPTDPLTDNTTQLMIIYRICIPVSSLFLIIVIIVYSLLWNSQNVHGFTILSYVCSLFLLYISLIISVEITEKGNIYCKIAGVAVHFFFVSTFCWLTAISFDIWWKFREIKASSQSKRIGRYLIYCTLSCAVPIIMITVGLSMDAVEERSTWPSSEQKGRFIAPNYGKRVCAVDESAQGWYIYFPVGILLFCNALFFGMTVYSMYNHKKSTNCILEGHCTKEDIKPIWLFSKLFIMMGIAWILELVAWAIRQEDHSPHRTFSWLTLIFDTVTLLQAVAIFYVFVCKKRIFVQLWHEHNWLRCVLLLFVKTGCCEIPPEKSKSFVNSPTEKSFPDSVCRVRKISNRSEASTTSKLSSSSV